MDKNDLAYLADHIAQGEVILFTGAGFSLSAQSEDGGRMPSSSDLTRELWPLAYGKIPYDGSRLGDVFGAAVRNNGNATKAYLSRRLRVNRNELPSEYQIWFSFPWYRIYTVNIDNLEEAVQINCELPRKLLSVSALHEPPPAITDSLSVIHLNGTLQDLPDVTFTQRNYAERHAHSDLWYPALVRELSSHPVLFVGSTLDEPPLWQYIEARPRRGRGHRELRPKSFLITPSLDLGRQSALGEFNIRLVTESQEEFCASTLSQLTDAAEAGQKRVASSHRAMVSAPALVGISEMTALPLKDAAELLIGRDPRWADVTNGYAIERAFDLSTLEEIQATGVRLVLITGTAGSGKSLSAMRTALALTAANGPGYLLNEDFTLGFAAIRDAVRASDARVLVVDNAPRFGNAMPDLLTALVEDSPDLVVIATIRTTNLDEGELKQLTSAGAVEFAVPPLADSDIEALLKALTDAHRLGAMRSLTRAQQTTIFRNKCGRQLIVAMIEATSGVRFSEKIASECRQLGGERALAYAILTIATANGASLTRKELLAACGGDASAMNNAVQRLIDSHLVVFQERERLVVRHRVIAECALAYYQHERSLGAALEGITFALATTVRPSDRNSRQSRLLRRLLNHATLIRLLFPRSPMQIDLDAVRSVYGTIEQLLTDDPHYWLQRGSFEVEEGDLDLARNFLGQARTMKGDDPKVLTEWAYMLLKRASQHAADGRSAEEAAEAFAFLDDAIEARGETDPYPYHVYGSQGLAWIKRSPMGIAARVTAFDDLRAIVRQGGERHPGDHELRKLRHDLDYEYMMLATDPFETVASDS